MNQTATAIGVQARLDALQAERDVTWPAEQRAAQKALRDSLAANVDYGRLVKVGDRMPSFRLSEVDGGTVDLGELLSTGPVALIFFRFEGCPACNAALPGYAELLAPAVRELGAELVAISPQAPERLAAIKDRHGFDFLVASDAGATLIDALGIGFAPNDDERPVMRAEGKDLGEILGTGSWTFPYATALVVDTDGVVRFADVHPDWMIRTEVDAIVDAVRALRPAE